MEMTPSDKKVENLLDQFKTTVINEDSLPLMKGPPMKIWLNRKHPDYRRMRCPTARRYPVHLEAEAEAEIQKLIQQGVIEKVTEPTEWVSPAFFVQKPNGGLRLVTDFSQLSVTYCSTIW